VARARQTSRTHLTTQFHIRPKRGKWPSDITLLPAIPVRSKALVSKRQGVLFVRIGAWTGGMELGETFFDPPSPPAARLSRTGIDGARTLIGPSRG
jgi:hypothetical protein